MKEERKNNGKKQKKLKIELTNELQTDGDQKSKLVKELEQLMAM